jgi:hypothetical protein
MSKIFVRLVLPKFKICVACANDLEAKAFGVGDSSRQGAKLPSDSEGCHPERQTV